METSVAKKRKTKKVYFRRCFCNMVRSCKLMDKEVFSKQEVGTFFKNNFIAVKVQMDKTPSDNNLVKTWYSEVKRMQNKYSVTVYPTYLFFDPAGNAVHKVTSYQAADKLINEGNRALDPEKQYYTILSKYKRGGLDTGQLKKLSIEYDYSGKEFAWNLAAEYLRELPERRLADRDVQEFMMRFREAPAVQKYAAMCLRKLPGEEYSNPLTSLFISMFKRSHEVQQVVFKYLAQLSPLEIKAKVNLLWQFTDAPVAKPIAEKYLKSLTERELFTNDNILLLANYTKSVKRTSVSNFL